MSVITLDELYQRCLLVKPLSAIPVRPYPQRIQSLSELRQSDKTQYQQSISLPFSDSPIGFSAPPFMAVP